MTVKGPKGTLERVLPAEMEIKKEGDEIIVNRPNDLKKMKSLEKSIEKFDNKIEKQITGKGYHVDKDTDKVTGLRKSAASGQDS